MNGSPVRKTTDCDTVGTASVELVKRLGILRAGTLPEGMENNSAYNVFDLFNAAAPSDKSTGLISFLNPFGLLGRIVPGKSEEKKGFKMPEIPENVMKAVLKYGNRLSGISNGRKSMDFDFED